MIQAFITQYGNLEAPEFSEMPVLDSLVTYYDFSDTGSIQVGNNTIYDLMGNGVGYLKACPSASVTPSTTYTPLGLRSYVRCDGQGNNGYNTNLVGSRIDINTRAAHVDRFNKYSNFTIQILSYPESNERIFSTGTAGSGCTDSCIWQMYLSAFSFFWWDSVGGGTNNINVGGTHYTTNQWNFNTITYQSAVGGNSIANVYNGTTLTGTQTIAFNILNVKDRIDQTNLQWTLGGGYYLSCVNVNTPSRFSVFLLYNRVLTAREIKINYNLYKDRFGI